VGDRLRPLWDFDDLDASEARLRAALNDETDDTGRAEVLTQLARVEGLRDRFDEGDALLDQAIEIGGAAPVVAIRVDLERGRLRRSGDDAAAALPHFVSAYEQALATGDEFLAVDAAHMAAIAAEGDARGEWTARGIELAERSDDPEVTYWLGPLFNNAGWDLFDDEDYEGALTLFMRALEERERRPDQPRPIEFAREAITEAEQALERQRAEG
jgi:tetratricopeptide (TPR) repeat protein